MKKMNKFFIKDMNRFSALNFDSEDEDEVLNNEDHITLREGEKKKSRKFVPLIQREEIKKSREMVPFTSRNKSREMVPLTSRNLLEVGDFSNNISCSEVIIDDPLITTARKNLYNMMKGNPWLNHLSELDIYRKHKFICYMSEKSKKYFTKLYYQHDGSWEGQIASIYTWKYGKKDDGSNMYLYISTLDYFGSCSFCDQKIADVEKLEDLYIRINDAHYMISILKGQERLKCYVNDKFKNDRKAQIVKNENIIKKNTKLIREMVKENILSICNDILITKSYNEATKYIIRRSSFRPPKFYDALKEAFPDKNFSHLQSQKNKKILLSDYIKTK